MLCPVCKTTTLLMSNRSNIEIDYCPDCRGVWLDRGELDKLIELAPLNNSVPQNYNTPHNNFPQNQQNNNQQYNHNSENYNSNSNYKHRKHKKEGWFGEIFDFD